MSTTSLRPLVPLLAAVAIYMVGFGVAIPVLPFLVKELGGTAEDQGLLVSAFSLAQFATAPLWGLASERLGRARAAALGFLLLAAGYLAAYLAPSITVLLAARLAAGVGGGALPAVQSLVAELAPPDRRASAMALFGMAFGLGFVVGPAVGGVLGALAGPRVPFLAVVAAAAAAAAAVSRAPNLRYGGGIRLELGLGLSALAFLLFNTAFTMFEGMVTYYAADAVGLSAQQVGLMMAAAGVAAGAAQPLVRAFERRGRAREAAGLGLALMAAGLALADLAVPAALYLGTALVALGNIAASSVLFASAAELGGSRGFNYGVIQSAGSLGRIVGPAAAGVIYQQAGHLYVFPTAVAVLAASAPLLLARYARS